MGGGGFRSNDTPVNPLIKNATLYNFMGEGPLFEGRKTNTTTRYQYFPSFSKFHLITQKDCIILIINRKIHNKVLQQHKTVNKFDRVVKIAQYFIYTQFYKKSRIYRLKNHTFQLLCRG